MTPKEHQIYNLPQVQELIERLDCIPLQSRNEKYNKAVEARVLELIQTFQEAIDLPAVKRTVVKWYYDLSKGPISALIGRNEEIEEYLVSYYGKRPWKYPLEKTPF